MHVSINTVNNSNNNNNTGSITDGNKGDITVSNNGLNWIINNQQLNAKFVYNEIPIGLINGSNPTFTSRNSFIPETLRVYINGLKQTLINDYLTTSTNQLLLVNSLQTTDLLTIDYIKA